jgi:acyl-CoA thioesterase I
MLEVKGMTPVHGKPSHPSVRGVAERVLAQVGRLALLVNLLLAVVAVHAAQAEPPIRLVAFGDSLTAGLGLPSSKSFPSQLSRAVEAKGYAVDIENAGVSGDTTADGLKRFDWAIPDGTEAVILELGANDILRGIDPARARTNLDKLLTKLKARNIEVLLTGMKAPENWGTEYADAFNPIYGDLAKKHGVLLYPFFLDGVAMENKLNQSDGMHPSAKGVALIVERMLPSVEQLIERVEARRRLANGKS